VEKNINKCQICGIINPERAHFYKTHKIRESLYYETYFPREDLLTGEPLKFKSKSSYFLNNFLCKNNLKTFLTTKSKETGLSYIATWLLLRKREKNLIYAPGTFEIKSLQFPSIKFIHKYYSKNAYEDICLKLGLLLKYEYNYLPEFNQNPIEILIDTRESKPWKFGYPTKIEKLDVADYCPNPNINNIFVERKEVSDWAGTLSNGYERFEKEMQRAKDTNKYIIIIIEAKYSDLLSINYLPQTRWIKASSEFLMKRMRDLYLKFDNFQMVCGGTRKECIILLERLFTIGNDVKKMDLQYYKDIGVI